MVLVVCSIRDKKSELFGNPFYAVTIGSAIRSFQDEVNHAHENNPMYRHPSDYELYQLGTFDNFSGELVNSIPKFVMAAADLVNGGNENVQK